MGCVTNACFAILVNGSPSEFFPASRGIRQGCPLSPYLFLLIIEGLSLILCKAKVDGVIKGIKVAGSLFLSHTLFVDDVIIFGQGHLEEWLSIKNLLDLFCNASGMSFSPSKSCFRHMNISEAILSSIYHIFHILGEPLDNGIKYLGFFLKPNCYSVSDWGWLVKKVQ